MKYYLIVFILLSIIIISYKLSLTPDANGSLGVYYSDEVVIDNKLPLIGGEYESITLNSELDLLYTNYLIDYNLSNINYDDFIKHIENILKYNANIKVNQLTNMLRTLNIDSNSQIKIYMQDNKEKSLTTIFLVSCGVPINAVKVIDLKDFITEIVVNSKSSLEVYLKQSDKRIIIDIS